MNAPSMNMTVDTLGAYDRMMTRHALERMGERSVAPRGVVAALTYGRVVHVRGADIHVIGKKEVERYRSEGVDLERFEGIQVVVNNDGAIVTIYRNRDLGSLKPRARYRGARRRRG